MITRDDEANFPDFDNLKDAIQFFQYTYGRLFKFDYMDCIDGESMSFYNMDGQSIQIGANGSVHITH